MSSGRRSRPTLDADHVRDWRSRSGCRPAKPTYPDADHSAGPWEGPAPPAMSSGRRSRPTPDATIVPPPVVRLLVVWVSVPAPVAAFPFFRLGSRRFLLLGPRALAPWRRVGAAAARAAHAGAARATHAWAAWRVAAGPSARTAWRSTEAAGPRGATGATRAAHAWAARRSARTHGRATRTRRAAEATGSRGAAETAGAWAGRFGLRFLDDDGAALQHTAGQLFDGRFGAFVRHRFDEREAARPSGFSIEGHPDAAQLYAVSGESLAQLLLGDRVRKVADEKSSTHPSYTSCVLLGLMWTNALLMKRGDSPGPGAPSQP